MQLDSSGPSASFSKWYFRGFVVTSLQKVLEPAGTNPFLKVANNLAELGTLRLSSSTKDFIAQWNHFSTSTSYSIRPRSRFAGSSNACPSSAKAAQTNALQHVWDGGAYEAHVLENEGT